MALRGPSGMAIWQLQALFNHPQRSNRIRMDSHLIEIYNRFTELQSNLERTDSGIGRLGFKI